MTKTINVRDGSQDFLFSVPSKATVPLVQLGPTCGIYSLYNALTLLGVVGATPPRKLKGSGISIRELAKTTDSDDFSGAKISYVGEIFGAKDMAKLAGELNKQMKGSSSNDLFTTALVTTGTDAPTFYGQLKAMVQNEAAAALPISVDPDTVQPKADTDAQHWIVVLGYRDPDELLCYDSNNQAVEVQTSATLFGANTQMKAFPASWWVKLEPREYFSAADMGDFSGSGGSAYPHAFPRIFDSFATNSDSQAASLLDGVVGGNTGTAALGALEAWSSSLPSTPSAFYGVDPTKLTALNLWLNGKSISNVYTGKVAGLLAVSHLPTRDSHTKLQGKFIEIKPK